MFLRAVARTRVLLPRYASFGRARVSHRFLCSETAVGDGETIDLKVGDAEAQTSEITSRFASGKATLMELFPEGGSPASEDVHIAKTKFFGTLSKWANAKNPPVEEIMDILYAVPSRFYVPFVQFITDRQLLPHLSIDDVKTVIRCHPKRNCSPACAPMLRGCIERLASEHANLSTVDATLVLISLSYISNADYGKLLGVFTGKILADVEAIPLNMMSTIITLLSRKRLLDRRFSTGLLAHIERHCDQMATGDLLNCAVSFSYARLLNNHHPLLIALDQRLCADSEKFTDSNLGAAVTLFRLNQYKVKLCQEVLCRNLTDPKKITACSSRTFASLSNYLCLYGHLDDGAVLTAIRSEIISRAKFEPKEVMLIVSTLSSLQLLSYDTGISPLDDIAKIIESHVPQLHAAQLVTLLLELRKVEALSTRLVVCILVRALETCDDLKIDDSVRLIHAAARIIRKENPSTGIKLMWKIAPQISAQVPHMQPRLVSMSSMSMNMLGVKHPLLCTAIAERGLAILSSGSPDIDLLSSMASSLARVDFPAVDFFVELHKHLENNMLPNISQAHLVRLTWACVAQGFVPRTVLRTRIFSAETAPTGTEELPYLQMLRDLLILSVYDGIFQVPSQSDALKSLFSAISAKQLQFEARQSFVDMLVKFMGEDCVLANGLTVESIVIPAAILFDAETGAPVPWSKVGVSSGSLLPQPRIILQKFNARAVALVSPSVIYPEKSPSGQTKMMCRLLGYSGWRTGMVPPHSWETHTTTSAKLDFLKQILTDTLNAPEAEAPSAPQDQE